MAGFSGALRRLGLRRAFGMAVLLGPLVAFGQTLPPDSLTDPAFIALLAQNGGGTPNLIELQAAYANQAAYDALYPLCTGQVAASCAPGTAVEKVWQKVSQIVDTANQLLGRGPTRDGLGLDARGLGFALRWTAGEEMASQGTVAKGFASHQMVGLAGRLTALRFAARGPKLAAAMAGNESMGGAASGDDSIASKWGGFVNGSYGYGDKHPTTDEDAFAYDGGDASVGIDYRFSPRLVAGGIATFMKRKLDFDSSQSVVDGNVDSRGFGVVFFTQLEGEQAYANASVGYQRLTHDMRRRIVYPSFNFLVPATDETALSSTASHGLIATLGGGYLFQRGAFSAEPFAKVEHQQITIDASDELGAPDFNLSYSKQDVRSTDAAVGLKLQYTLTPRFGIVVPFARGEYHRDLSPSDRSMAELYSALSSIAVPKGGFNLGTDSPDKNYYVVAGGLSIVFKHGFQGFLQYQQVLHLASLSDRAIMFGFRFER